ncbi:hypothetical protein NC652_011025 [Populus alba x Populus x berolinensis]|nr:hypothetical protein NC652_011025 [Populus alba x Populus x berolinensis]
METFQLGAISAPPSLYNCELMWDLDDLLQNTVNAQNDQAAVSDSDSDEMDVDTKPPKSRKGAKRKNENANGAASMSKGKRKHLLVIIRNHTIQEIQHVFSPYGPGNVISLQCSTLAISGLQPCALSELENEELTSFRE